MEVRKLDWAAKHVQSIKRKQEIAKWNKLQEREKQDAGKMLLDGFSSEPGKLTISQKPKENFVESSELKNARELSGAKTAYQEQLKKTHETHIWELKDKPEEQMRVWQEYLGRCVKDLWINPENIGKDDVKVFAETLPKAWKKTLLDSKSVEKNPELKKVRDEILLQGFKVARRWDMTDAQYQEALLKNMKEVTGIDDLTQEDVAKILEGRIIQYEEKEKEESLLLTRGVNESPEAYESRVRSSSGPMERWEVSTNIEWWETGWASGYFVESWKEASESSRAAAEKIKKAFQKKYSSPNSWPEAVQGSLFQKLSLYIDRHAKNNPKFSSNQPFLMQDLRAQKAYIYYPWGEIMECSATHGTGGVSNTDKSHWTSLGSKELVPDTNGSRNGNKILLRTAVKWLEWCNQNDLSRTIRIHEQHGSRTHWCTGLPLSEMQRFDAAIDQAGGGAQEIFLG